MAWHYTFVRLFILESCSVHSNMANFSDPRFLGGMWPLMHIVYLVSSRWFLAFNWPYIMTPIGTALAALVTQIYLGLRQVYKLVLHWTYA